MLFNEDLRRWIKNLLFIHGLIFLTFMTLHFLQGSQLACERLCWASLSFLHHNVVKMFQHTFI